MLHEVLSIRVQALRFRTFHLVNIHDMLRRSSINTKKQTTKPHLPQIIMTTVSLHTLHRQTQSTSAA